MTVLVELPNRASLPARIAHPIAKATLRTGLNIMTFAGEKRPIKDPRVFWVSNHFDPAARVIVAVPGTRRRPALFDKFRAEWVWHRDTADPAQVSDSAILYMHGGGFVSCGLNTHRRIVSRIARASGVPVLDPMIHAGALEIVTKWGFQRNGTIDPAWSAVNHSFEGLPPALIQVGSTEVLLSDCERLAQRYAEAGIRCRLQVWDRQIHVWHAGADLLPEGRAAIREIGAFHQRILNGTVRPYRTRLRRALDRRLSRADRAGVA